MPEETKSTESKSSEAKETQKKKTGKIIGTVIGVVVSVLILAVVGLGVGVYYAKAKDGFFSKVADVLPYPAGRVGSSAFSVSAYNDNVRALVKYFSVDRQTDLNDTANADVRVQVEQSILYRMVEDATLVKVASDLGVTVSEDDINTEFQNVIKELGDETEAAKTLEELYGWSVEDFKANVLEPQIRKEKIREKFMEDKEFTRDERAKAEEVLAKLKDGGDFAALAKEYSEDPQSAVEGGDLGTNAKGVFVTEFEDAALALEPGQVSEIVQTPFGFHIIKLESKSDTELHARHILIATDFDAYVKERVKEQSISIFVRGYEWDVEGVTVKITDSDGDGVDDERDVDDDNDGASDEDETTAGSDPKVKSSTPETVAPTTTETVPTGTETTDTENIEAE